MLSPSYIILRTQRLEGKQCVNLDEGAHNEPPHQDQCCLQSQLFLSLVLKEFIYFNIYQQSKYDMPAYLRTKVTLYASNSSNRLFSVFCKAEREIK